MQQKIGSDGCLRPIAPGCLRLLGYEKRFYTAWAMNRREQSQHACDQPSDIMQKI
jgi:hypothetical protein